MAVLIDPPRWPAHGTTFSHLVSDSSLEQLHAFAARAGVPERAFDRDHYDVAAHRYDELVALGALPVTGRELIRRLRASGLRVTSRDRAEHVVSTLRHRWPESLGGAIELRESLLARWSEPHRRYHAVGHLLAVLERLDELVAPDPVPATLVLAAWFHDAVYEGANDDEEASARLAERELAGIVTPGDVAEVARLVRLTSTHHPVDGDTAGELLCDADLAILGSGTAEYDRYVSLVRQDYAHVSDDDWRTGRAAVLDQLLALDPLFRTERGRALWASRADSNLRRELGTLRSR